MKQTTRWLGLGASFILMILTLPVQVEAAEAQLTFSGGPAGGTFQYFSNGISARLTKDLVDVRITNLASAGSIENIRKVNAGEADFGIAYSGDTFLARNGLLAKDAETYQNVHALAFLYGAPAHLLVLASSGINSVSGLVGKRVAVGGAGSGAAASAQRYFSTLGLWDQMKIEFIGYSKAAEALLEDRIDAMWVFAGFPNSAVAQAAERKNVKILDTWEAGQTGGVFTNYPFYAPVTIPGGTYNGVKNDVKTFQDAALWIAGKHVATKHVEEALADIFTPEGLSFLVKVKSTAKAMSIDGALTNIVTPLHEGAEKFWRGQGLQVSAEQSAR